MEVSGREMCKRIFQATLMKLMTAKQAGLLVMLRREIEVNIQVVSVS